MNMTQQDYETRAARLADGTSPDPDDDRRLVALYEREGFGVASRAVALDDDAQAVDEPVQEQGTQRGTHERAPARATGKRGTR